ncbi:MAG: pectate lyase [Bacteroidales bacterium]|nr:pectate lyase [Candidatus Colicola faecequi]
MKTKSLLLGFALLLGTIANAAVNITKQAGWLETAYAEWAPLSGYTDYNVYVKPTGGNYTKIDKELVRNYGSYLRADALGLAAGQYQLKIVPVNGTTEATAEASETDVLTVSAHDRAGFAHQGRTEGVGAYNNDGTLKANAKVIYVYANNASTVEASILYDKAEATFAGIQTILSKLEKGTETAPICIRIIGCLKKNDIDYFASSAEGIQIKGKNNTIPMNITIEGVGEDATVHGFGFLVRNVYSAEFRNFGVMICMDDCISLDTNNKNIWIHNMDFFYGGTGSDSDQAKGDGTVDVKGKSTNITISYNHFWDSGKSSLGGMKSETTDCMLTYHHNWFDHSDSRHPRIRTMSFHIYNNYFDGNSKYGVGMTMGGSAFVENNYFRSCKYPMLISKQGTDATGDGTFSGEAGGVIKAFGNTIINARRYVSINSQSSANTITAGDGDAYEAATRNEVVPSNVTCKSGSTGYNNFDTNGTLAYTYTPDPADSVKSIVTGNFGAGRVNHGDFHWQFNNMTEDQNYDVISSLKNELLAYTSSLVGFCNPTLPASVNNGGYTGGRSGGDSQKNEDFLVNWGSTTPGTEVPDIDMVPFLGTNEDFYWFNEENNAQTLGLISDGTIVVDTAYCKYSATLNGSNSTLTDPHTGSIQVFKENGRVDFHYPAGICSISLNMFRTGSFKAEILTSDDGQQFTKIADITGNKGELIKTAIFTPVQYVRILNTATGSTHIHGIKLFTPDNGETPGPETAIEHNDIQPKAEKLLINGQIVIRKDGKLYSITGMLLHE